MCKVTDAVCKLSASERESLQCLGTGPFGSRLPSGDLETLIRLGFVEVLCGRAEQTPFGRRAALKLGSLIRTVTA